MLAFLICLAFWLWISYWMIIDTMGGYCSLSRGVSWNFNLVIHIPWSILTPVLLYLYWTIPPVTN